MGPRVVGALRPGNIFLARVRAGERAGERGGSGVVPKKFPPFSYLVGGLRDGGGAVFHCHRAGGGGLRFAPYRDRGERREPGRLGKSPSRGVSGKIVSGAARCFAGEIF